MTRNTESFTTTNFTTSETVTELQPFDVLSGRDKQSFNHIGNRRFRVVIGMNLQRYLDTKSRYERSEMILAFVRELRSEAHIRFLKRRGSKYIELDEKQSREKVGHALRDAAAQARAQQNQNQQKHQRRNPVSRSKLSRQKHQQQKQEKLQQENKNQNVKRHQLEYQPLPLTMLPIEDTTTTKRMSFDLSSTLINDNDEFSLSDESLDSLLSFVNEEEMEFQREPRHFQYQEEQQPLLDLGFSPNHVANIINDDFIDQVESAEYFASQLSGTISVGI